MNTAETAKRWIHTLAGALAQGAIARGVAACGACPQASSAPAPLHSSTRQGASPPTPRTTAV
jgi:hypothetical protein